MDTSKLKSRERISALCDGELKHSDLELAKAELHGPDGQLAWKSYHRIGEALRSKAVPELPSNFMEKLAMRLALEPDSPYTDLIEKLDDGDNT